MRTDYENCSVRLIGVPIRLSYSPRPVRIIGVWLLVISTGFSAAMSGAAENDPGLVSIGVVPDVHQRSTPRRWIDADNFTEIENYYKCFAPEGR